jgi:hypothetical protein
MLSLCNPQRDRDDDAEYGTDAWDVELVEDEQWGRVLVAQRDFSPGEVIIRSAIVVIGRGAAACVRCADKFLEIEDDDDEDSAVLTDYIEWATTSPR